MKSAIYQAYVFTLLSVLSSFSSVHAKDIDIAVGWTKPPYVIERGNTGFEVDLVREVFIRMGHKINLLYVPFARSHYLLKLGHADAAMTLNHRVDVGKGVLSKPYIIYRNVAVSLKGRAIHLSDISSLHKYTVVGFQNANLVLGSAYKKAIESSPFYVELPDQRKQVEMLLKGKADIVVMDINIFNHLSREFTGKSHMGNVNIHRIFPDSPYRMGFRDAAVSDDFDRTMAEYKTSADYQNLLNKYEFFQ